MLVISSVVIKFEKIDWDQLGVTSISLPVIVSFDEVIFKYFIAYTVNAAIRQGLFQGQESTRGRYH